MRRGCDVLDPTSEDPRTKEVGLILPAAVDVVPVMVPVTAVCWALLMIGAMITHGRRGEPRLAVVNLVYPAVAVFIAWGRFGQYSFQ